MSEKELGKRTCHCGGNMVLCPAKYATLINGVVYNVTPKIWKCTQCHNEKIATSEFAVYEGNDSKNAPNFSGVPFVGGSGMAKHFCKKCGTKMNAGSIAVKAAFVKEEEGKEITAESFAENDLFLYDLVVQTLNCSRCGTKYVATGKIVVYEDNDKSNTLKETKNSSAVTKSASINTDIPEPDSRANDEMGEVDENVDPGEAAFTEGDAKDTAEDTESEENEAYDPGDPACDYEDAGGFCGEIPEPAVSEERPDIPDDNNEQEDPHESDTEHVHEDGQTEPGKNAEAEENSEEEDTKSPDTENTPAGTGKDETQPEAGPDENKTANEAGDENDVPPDLPVQDEKTCRDHEIGGVFEEDNIPEQQEDKKKTEKPFRIFDIFKKKKTQKETEAFLQPPVVEEIKGDVLYSTRNSDFICDEIKKVGYGSSSSLLKRYYYKTKKGRFFSVDVISDGKTEITILDESQMKVTLSKKPELYRKFISDYEV